MEKLHNTCCQSKFRMLDSLEQKEFSKQNKDTDCFDACTKVNLLLLRFVLICCFVQIYFSRLYSCTRIFHHESLPMFYKDFFT